MSNDQSFAELLRELRIKVRKSMGETAREVGITTVYYSEVEAGKKPAFPTGKFDYQRLANALDTQLELLIVAAEADRSRRKILQIFGCEERAVELAVKFGRRLSDNDLTPDQISKISSILEDGCES